MLFQKAKTATFQAAKYGGTFRILPKMPAERKGFKAAGVVDGQLCAFANPLRKMARLRL